jgi:hypothetical protein
MLAAVAVLPGFVKRPLYRGLFGYRIGRGVRIGLVLLDADDVELGDGTEIGHLNLITRVGSFVTGRSVRIGPLNIIRGGEHVRLGDYAEVMRLNVLNAIPDHDCTTSPVSRLDIGKGAVVVSGHRIDFTDQVTIGRNVIGAQLVPGRNRQQTRPLRSGTSVAGIRGPPSREPAWPSASRVGPSWPAPWTHRRWSEAFRWVRPLSAEDEVLIHRRARPDAPTICIPSEAPACGHGAAARLVVGSPRGCAA